MINKNGDQAERQATIVDVMYTQINSVADSFKLLKKGKVKLNGAVCPFNLPLNHGDFLEFGSWKFVIDDMSVVENNGSEPETPDPSLVG
jgi:hypothetical protein